MSSYKLNINGISVGIKKVDDNTFIPKNIDVLGEVFTTKTFDIKRSDIYDNTPIDAEAKEWDTIRSFCTVVTENLKEEGAILIESLRMHHEQPIYVTCDSSTKLFLQARGFRDVFFNCTANKPRLESINKRYFSGKRHDNINKFHKPAPIFKKMEAMSWALRQNINTFFLDCDIIVLNNLQEKFTKPVCLSPHYYPKADTLKGFQFGFYNAGYVFTTDKKFPNIWKWLYLNDSTFYEQEGMNRIPEFKEVETFGKEHNFGLWRDVKNVPPDLKSLHAHLSKNLDKDANIAHLKMNENIRKCANNVLKNHHQKLYKYTQTVLNLHKRDAFIHYGKCAGQYTENYICSHILRPSYKLYNSWWSNRDKQEHKHIVKRDYTKKELLDILAKIQKDDWVHVHNQHINWCNETVKAYKDNNFFTYTFLRDPKDLLCSLMFWSNEKGVKLSSHMDNSTNLNDMFEKCIEDEGLQRLWQLPNYIHMIDSVMMFNHDNFKKFLYERYAHQYTPGLKRNTSQNKGFDFYYQNGDIDKGLVDKLMKTDAYKEYYKYGLID